MRVVQATHKNCIQIMLSPSDEGHTLAGRCSSSNHLEFQDILTMVLILILCLFLNWTRELLWSARTAMIITSMSWHRHNKRDQPSPPPRHRLARLAPEITVPVIPPLNQTLTVRNGDRILATATSPRKGADGCRTKRVSEKPKVMRLWCKTLACYKIIPNARLHGP